MSALANRPGIIYVNFEIIIFKEILFKFPSVFHIQQ